MPDSELVRELAGLYADGVGTESAVGHPVESSFRGDKMGTEVLTVCQLIEILSDPDFVVPVHHRRDADPSIQPCPALLARNAYFFSRFHAVRYCGISAHPEESIGYGGDTNATRRTYRLQPRTDYMVAIRSRMARRLFGKGLRHVHMHALVRGTSQRWVRSDCSSS
jgi:hypothetical protein